MKVMMGNIYLGLGVELMLILVLWVDMLDWVICGVEMRLFIIFVVECFVWF